MKALLLFICSIFYEPVIVEDHFDLVEINTIRQDDGSIRLKQFIWWDLNDPTEIHSTRICQGWLNFNEVGGRMTRVGNHSELVWWDGKLCRRVTCRAFIVTETWGRDPEVDNRQLVPQTHRRGLSEP
jgi:hypothetical protein